MFSLDWLGRLRQRMSETAVRNRGNAKRAAYQHGLLRPRFEQLEQRRVLAAPCGSPLVLEGFDDGDAGSDTDSPDLAAELPGVASDAATEGLMGNAAIRAHPNSLRNGSPNPHGLFPVEQFPVGDYPVSVASADLNGDGRFYGYAAYGLLKGPALYGTGSYYIYGLEFEQGTAHAADHADNDRADLFPGAVWDATGDWEVIIDHSAPGGATVSGLDLAFARWIAALEDAETTSKGDGQAGEVDLLSLDYLFTLYGGR